MSEALKSSQGSLFVQLTPGKAPDYLGCVDVDAVSEPAGDQGLILCRDTNGDFKTVGSTSGAPGAVTTSLQALTFPESDVLDTIRKCLVTLYLMTRQCGKAGIFSNYARGLVLHHARITTRSFSNVVRRLDDTEMIRQLDISAWYPVYQVREVAAARQAITETRDLNAIAFDADENCGGECGVARAAGEIGNVVSDGNAGTPYLNGDLWLTDDGGGTWANATSSSTHPFSTISNILSIVRYGVGRNATRILVARAAEVAAPAKVSYSDDDGATWTEVTVGSTNNEGALGPGALFALDWEHIWFATSSGNIYFSADGGATFTVQSSAVTADSGKALYAVKFSDSDNGWAVGATDALIQTLDGGDTWSAVTAPTSSDTINSLWAWSRDRIILGSNAGEVWQTWDGGDNWESKTYTGKAVTDTVQDLVFVNDLIGYMLVNTSAPVGYIHRTLDGGHSFERLTTPTNAGLNALSVVDINLAYACGNAQGGTGVLVKVSG